MMACFYLTEDGDGVLAVNNEYPNPNTLYPHQEDLPKNTDDVLKSQNMCGFSKLGLNKDTDNCLSFDLNSKYNRRITAHTPMNISGPAKAHELMQTAADSKGENVLGTVGNCSSGRTPRGTYPTCEGSFDDMFGASDEGAINDNMKRYGVKAPSIYGWELHDERFDVAKNPNEINRFGWVVEIDALTPDSTSVKRPALGHFKYENVALQVADSVQVVANMLIKKRTLSIIVIY